MQGTRTYGRKRIVIECLFVLLIGALIAVDQITKHYFSTRLELHESIVVIKNFFYFSYEINTGAAWSFLANVSWSQIFFKILTVLALIGFIIMYVFSVKNNSRWLKVSLIFIIGGTIGNFIDRLLFNGVKDFISFVFGNYHFPVFNLADSFLVVGVIMLVIYFLFIDKNSIFKVKNADK